MLNEEQMAKFVCQVQDVLNEIIKEQTKIESNIEKYHKINMKKFAKLREYNEICDMTNQVFEKRISNIEQMLQEIIRNKSK